MEEKAPIPYITYLMVWLALLLLTGVTITAAGMHFGQWSAVAAIAIATIKGSLVLFIFMHLKYESALFKISLMLALSTMAIILLLTFTDISFR